MKTIRVVQYLRPNARKQQQYTDVSDAAGAKFQEIEALGLILTAEVVPPDFVSVCISDDARGADYAQILAPNSPGLQGAIGEMLLAFDAETYTQWAEDLDAQ